MSNPSPVVFELCTAIDRFHERVPDLSVSEVLAAIATESLREPSRCKQVSGARHWNVLLQTKLQHLRVPAHTSKALSQS